MFVERITAEAQATIPDAVLETLGLEPGDSIAFEIVDGRVSLHRAGDEDGRSVEQLAGLDLETLRTKIRNAIDDPRPSVPIAEAFARVRQRLEARWKADDA